MKTTDFKNKILKLAQEYSTKNIRIIDGNIRVFCEINGEPACVITDYVGDKYDADKGGIFFKKTARTYKQIFTL